jgi:hypothetical protein
MFGYTVATCFSTAYSFLLDLPIYGSIAAEAGTFKPVATPNASPPAEGSGDCNDKDQELKTQICGATKYKRRLRENLYTEFKT